MCDVEHRRFQSLFSIKVIWNYFTSKEFVNLLQVNKTIGQLTQCNLQQRQNDISLGQSIVPIPCSNGIDKQLFPDFIYIRESLVVSRNGMPLSHVQLYEGCECLNCNESCPCRHGYGLCYTKNAKLVVDTHLSTSRLIFECNTNCKCLKNCPTRVVQKGCQLGLKLQKFQHKGWGVVTDSPIAKGTYVGEYAGEIISSELLRNRRIQYDFQSLNYLLCIREYDTVNERYLRTNIDATQKGNISRFFNHSCQPSLFLETVRINSIVPHIAFFASRDICQGEELTFDYGFYPDWENRKNDSRKSTIGQHCFCGTPMCRKQLPFDPTV